MGAAGGAGPVGSRLKAVNVVKAIPKGGSDLERLLSFQIRAAGLPTPQREWAVDPSRSRRWRFDFAWPERMLAVEVEGGTWVAGRHTRGATFEADCEKYNTASGILGWTVLRFTTDMVEDGRALTTIQEVLRVGDRLRPSGDPREGLGKES